AVIRRRNEQIDNQAHNARETQRALEQIAHERDEARRYECSDLDAHWRLGEALASLKDANPTVASLRAEQPRPLTADDIEQLVTQNRYRVADAIRALYPEEPMATDVLAHAVMTALTEPTRPEEKVEAVLHQYWSGDINGDDLANRIVEEMNLSPSLNPRSSTSAPSTSTWRASTSRTTWTATHTRRSRRPTAATSSSSTATHTSQSRPIHSTTHGG